MVRKGRFKIVSQPSVYYSPHAHIGRAASQRLAAHGSWAQPTKQQQLLRAHTGRRGVPAPTEKYTQARLSCRPDARSLNTSPLSFDRRPCARTVLPPQQSLQRYRQPVDDRCVNFCA